MEEFTAVFVFNDGTRLTLSCEDRGNLNIDEEYNEMPGIIYYEIKNSDKCRLVVDGKIKCDCFTVMLNSIKYYME